MPLGTLDRAPPPFFRQGPSALSKLAVCSALALFLMVADARFKVMQPLRMVLGTVLIGTGLAACFSAALYDALWTLLGVDVCFAMAIVLGWWFFGRRILTLSDLLKVPLYAIWKLPIYLTFILKKRARWIRTERDDR